MPPSNRIVTIGVPKGSLEKSTLELFARAGYAFYGSERSLWLSSNDPEIKPVLLRPQEIPRYVAAGDLDCGLSGFDWITETNCGSDVRILADLCYSKRTFRPVRWVLAVAGSSPYHSVEDLRTMTQGPLRISTELRSVTERWIAERGIIAEVDFSWGATEAKVPVFADAIVECTETGASLQANGLRILDTVIESTTQFFACKSIYREDTWKREKLDAVALMLKSCLAADSKVRVRFQAPSEAVDQIMLLFPKEVSATTWEGQGRHVLFDILVEKSLTRDLLPRLVEKGASRISVAPIAMLYE